MSVVRLTAISDWYVSPAEFGDWVRDWVKQHHLHFLFARNRFRGEARFKFEVCQRLPWKDRALVTRTIRDYRHLYLSVVGLRANVSSMNELVSANLDRLRANLPDFSERGMTGLGLELGVESSKHKKVYDAIVKDLHDRTAAGVWFRFAKGKKKEWFDPHCRYAPGAATLLEQGVPLAAGGNIVVSQFGSNRKAG